MQLEVSGKRPFIGYPMWRRQCGRMPAYGEFADMTQSPFLISDSVPKPISYGDTDGDTDCVAGCVPKASLSLPAGSPPGIFYVLRMRRATATVRGDVGAPRGHEHTKRGD